MEITKEPQLLWKGKEREADILADTMSLPFQEVKRFGQAKEGDWVNKLIFGDNLQALKYLLKLKKEGRLRNPDGSDGIKLVYIDPPFATKQDFEAREGERAYSDKLAGADFLEFLRKRLILIRELLSEDGSIFLHLDWKKTHYVKVLMDEIFGENHLRNEIVWCYHGPGSPGMRQFNRKHDTLLWYCKGDKWIFNGDDVRVELAGGLGGGWEGLDEKTRKEYAEKGKIPEDWWEIAIAARLRIDGVNRAGYPTEKPEKLIDRIIRASSKEGDLVMDCFAGSGIVGFVAEKNNRRWILVDIGKLSVYSIQKRILNINKARLVEDPKKTYNKKHKPFTVYNVGLYDYNLIEQLGEEDYKNFVLDLFQVDKRNFKLNGLDFHGKLFGGPVKVFDRKGFLTEDYIKDLHETVGDSISDCVFIIAPATNVEFISTTVELGDKRYYILKVPYSIIDELHSKPFKRLIQPNSASKINEIVDSVGFDFIYPPEVKRDLLIQSRGGLFPNAKDYVIHVKSIIPIQITNNPVTFENELDALAGVFVDYNYDGKTFNLSQAFFADEVREEGDAFKVKLESEKLGDNLCIIYLDVLGNEKIEVIKKSNFEKKK